MIRRAWSAAGSPRTDRATRVLLVWVFIALACLALETLAAVNPAAALEIGPTSDFCAALKTLNPGDELVLRPGDYQGPCAIRRGGTPGTPVVVRAADLTRRPRIVYHGSTTNVLEVRTSHLILRGLEFGPTLADVDAVRIFAGDDITVEECRFSDLGGIAVVANHSNVRGLRVRRNEILYPRSTAMYFGCHDGRGCVVSDLVVEQNYFRQVTAADPYIGYAVELKLNTTGVVRGNVIIDTKGPGIMVYGAINGGQASLVEQNFVMGSRSSSGIVVGGGPAVVRNNIAVENAEGGIGVEDYRKRGLLRGIVVAHNTVYQNGLGGILVPDSGPVEATIARNAVAARPGTPALPVARAGVTVSGNVDCSTTICFSGPSVRDFSPVPGSPLGQGPETQASAAWTPLEDFFGMRRGVPSTVGAVERRAGAVPTGVKP